MRTPFLLLSFSLTLCAQNADPGRIVFENNCARCHGADGRGGDLGPPIANRLPTISDEQVSTLIRTGRPDRGMPATQVTDAQLPVLTRFVRSLAPRGGRGGVVMRTVELTTGGRLDGQMLGQGFADLTLKTSDGKVHLLRTAGEKYREVTSQVDWPSYNGDQKGNRYTTMTQITPANVNRLGPKWIFAMPNAGRLQGTPLVVGGMMYVTGGNQCIALDAGTGRQIWRYQYPGTRGLTGNTATSTNRGAETAGDKVFFQSSNAHLIALNRFTGELLWDTQVADTKLNYFSSSAPLAARSLIVAGLAGGEHGARGLLVAFDQATGKEAWRFYTVPLAGEPGSETWKGKGIEHPGAPTWFTGSYDAGLDTLYWSTGNPSAEYNGDDREGDNLYANCILALDAKTGKLKWHYQFTPHDLWDWDSTETAVLVDANWQGQPRKLMLHGDRNGFFYVLDRTNGKLLLAKQFLKELTWASGIGADGRPIRLPNQEPTAAGTRVCPSQDGATNWYSPSFNPATGLFYMQTNEMCSVYIKRDPGTWEVGREYLGGVQRRAPSTPEATPQRILRAIDIQTGKVTWELPQQKTADSWGGTLATATGLVIFGEEGGGLMAVDAKTGKPLWSFQTNESWHASPLTYMFDNKQYVAVAAGSNIISFGILE